MAICNSISLYCFSTKNNLCLLHVTLKNFIYTMFIMNNYFINILYLQKMSEKAVIHVQNCKLLCSATM